MNTDTGEIIPAYVFVAVLSCSQYAYVEAFLAQDMECWIAAHIHAFRYFGGITRIVVPDNLKTGVDKVSWYTPVINRPYHEMAEHYGTAIVPARVRVPRIRPPLRALSVSSQHGFSVLCAGSSSSLLQSLMTQWQKSWMPLIQNRFKRNRAVGIVHILKKRNTCYHYRQLHMNWRPGRSPRCSTTTISPWAVCTTLYPMSTSNTRWMCALPEPL